MIEPLINPASHVWERDSLLTLVGEVEFPSFRVWSIHDRKRSE